jgi:hypothetical protein
LMLVGILTSYFERIAYPEVRQLPIMAEKRQYSIGSDAGDHLERWHKAGAVSLSIEPFELGRLRGGGTLVVWILNGVLVLCVRVRDGS